MMKVFLISVLLYLHNVATAAEGDVENDQTAQDPLKLKAVLPGDLSQQTSNRHRPYHQYFDKPGTCPGDDFSARPCLDRGRHCHSDISCPGVQKCCRNRCNVKCVEPYSYSRPKPGSCPRVATLIPCNNPTRYCQNDQSCSGNQKCCDVGCQHRCTSPGTFSRPKPGSCPRVMTLIACNNNPTRYCQNDQSCSGNQKCCDVGCLHRCTSPVPSGGETNKPGQCPDTSGIITTCEIKPGHCNSDAECPRRQKCCSRGCGPTCLDPVSNGGGGHGNKPGTCPDTSGFVTTCLAGGFHDKCQSDSQCPRRQKCCKYGCGKSCLAPAQVISRPSQCPAPIYNGGAFQYCPAIEDLCHHNGDCGYLQQCCSDGCTKSCKYTISSDQLHERPGRCPAPVFNKPGQYCPAIANTCESDAVCPRGRKCCHNGCGSHCLHADDGVKISPVD